MLKSGYAGPKILEQGINAMRMGQGKEGFIAQEETSCFGSSTLILQSSFHIRLVRLAASTQAPITFDSPLAQPAHLSYLSNLSRP
jgi:hypothetical protein